MYKKRIVTPGIVLAVFLTIGVGCTSQAQKDKTSPHPSKDLSGTWKTNVVNLHLTQSGNTVSGTYDYEGGTLEGTITGNRLDYTWNQTNGKKGRGYFIISDDWKSISGSYGYNDDDSNGGEWKGTKVGVSPRK
jgi:hypothetical protein